MAKLNFYYNNELFDSHFPDTTDPVKEGFDRLNETALGFGLDLSKINNKVSDGRFGSFKIDNDSFSFKVV